MTAAADPGAAWMQAMRSGAWERAWHLSDAALAARGGRRDWSLPRHLQAVWDGTPLAGRRVLVRCHHGLGDTIQFVRFLPAVQAMAAEVTLWAQPALIPLLATLRDPPRLLPLHDGAPDGAWDAEAEIMELPHILRTTLRTLPARTPYLHPPPVPRARHGGLAVGLVWQAGAWAPQRSVPPALLRPLARIPGVVIHALQQGPALAAMPPGLGIPSGAEAPLRLAGVMASLDLVVSVDSMPAHLAGALGRPVWLMLPRDADWRWMEGREDSPWYPGMRLFRQDAAGDWRGVVARVAAGLAALGRGAAAGKMRGSASRSAGDGMSARLRRDISARLRRDISARLRRDISARLRRDISARLRRDDRPPPPPFD